MKATGEAATLGKVLVVDGDSKRTDALCDRLRFLNFEPVNGLETLEPLTDSVAIMLGDVSGGSDSADHLINIAKTHSSLPILKLDHDDLSGDGLPTFESAQIWALDAPLRRSQLEYLLHKAVRYRGKERRRSRITGNSTSIRNVRAMIEQVAEFDTTVLITGESGTGKELVARTVHDLSRRSDQPFVPVNCGAIPPELLESELFGHEKGAFTGAITSRKGRFELAEGGTLFLDEIGDMSLEMQAKLLRVLQERTFERVGSNQSRRADVRIIAATHRNLVEASATGDFREDLFYRLNVFPIRMPPLRKRASDLPALLDELLVQHGEDESGGLRLKADAIGALARYPWPGNIRELSNLVERLAIMHPDGEIGLDALPEKYREFASSAPADDAGNAIEFDNLNLKEHLGQIERNLIRKALEQADGVVAEAARQLNLRRTTLVEKLGKYGIEH